MNKASFLLIISLIAIGCLRIAATHTATNQSYDEAAHIACGMEWLDKGVYRYEPQHPPLTRIMMAVGPYLNGSRSHGEDDMWAEGNAILYSGDYVENLRLARSGNLLFFTLACIGVVVVANILYGTRVALVSLFVFSMMPSVLGSSGMATTDMGVTAFFVPAMLAVAFWLKRPTIPLSLLTGLLLALCVFSKFSSILFVGVSTAALFLVMRVFDRDGDSFPSPGRYGSRGLVALAVFLLTGWSVYRFSVEPVLSFPRDLHWVDFFHARTHLPKDFLMLFGEIGLPLSEFVRGIGAVAKHNAQGHGTYLLGQTSSFGWWYYYPVILLIKLPFAVLAALLLGLACLLFGRKGKRIGLHLLPVVVICSVLLACMFVSNINIGIRHILPIIPFVAIVCGYGVVRLATAGMVGKFMAGVVLVVLGATSLLAHPDYISFFNPIAREKPYEWAVKSDLDWGQHLVTLSERLREKGIDKVSIAYYGRADMTRHGLPEFVDLSKEMPAKVDGWVAISAHSLFLKPRYAWLLQYEPEEIIKKSLFLYHFETPVPTSQ